MVSSSQAPPALPEYFGPDDRRLFGCFSPSGRRSGRSRPPGVVVCPPFGHEYVRSHRALRVLAERLAAAGFAVLRFDFGGCGDSAGAEDEVSFGLWLADLSSACEHLRSLGSDEVALVGRGLGANIVGRCQEEISARVLWDPVVLGEAHLQRLEDLHRAYLAKDQGTRPVDLTLAEGPETERLGTLYPSNLVSEIEALDLARDLERTAGRGLILEAGGGGDALASTPSPGTDRWRVEAGSRDVELDLTDLLDQQVPVAAIERIVAWLCEVAPGG